MFQCFFCEECGLLDLALDTLSESDGLLSLSVSTGYYSRIEFKEQSLRVGGMVNGSICPISCECTLNIVTVIV